jgi:hypothetical protein
MAGFLQGFGTAAQFPEKPAKFFTQQKAPRKTCGVNFYT